MLFQWAHSGERATVLSINAVTAETSGKKISIDINVNNSPEEFDKSFDRSNVSFEEILKGPKLVNLTN